MTQLHSSYFFPSRSARAFTLIFIFGLAVLIRLYDLTDLPLDFHPTRQLLSAIKARGIYFETQPDGIPTWKLEMGIEQAKLKADVEPVIFEHLVALTYRFTGEQLWVARVYSSLFWVIGGGFLFLLLRELVSEGGALLAVAYYLFFPYAVIASRSFQPDPLMVAIIIIFWWVLNHWTRTSSWKWALLAGLVGGSAIFIKFVAAFFVIGGTLGAALGRSSLRDLVRNPQAWTMALLGILPGAAYIVYGVYVAGFLGKQFGGRFIPSLLLSPMTYLNWESKAALAAGGVVIAFGLLGLFFVREGSVRSFLFGLWGAYILYGLYFDYHVATHDYYHLPLIPIVAISLAPLADAFAVQLRDLTAQRRMRFTAIIILLFGLFSILWDVRNQMKSVDYRPEAAMWAKIGDQLGHERNTVALTQDYGSRLQYWGWQIVDSWPTSGDLYYVDARGGQPSLDKLFNELAGKKKFFLVTDFDELEFQPQLKERLSTYPIFAEGEGYIIYSLRKS